MTPTVKLGGVDLGGSNAYEWPLKTGVQPHERIFTVTERVAEQLRQASQGVNSTSPGLIYEVHRPDGKPSLTVRRLFIADIFPGATTHTRRVRVVDVRWLWQHVYISSTFNERRVTGDTNVVAEGANPETPQIDPEIRYAKYSLHDEERVWTASNVLRHVMTTLNGHAWRLDDRIASRFDQTPVDDLILEDAGHYALERILAYVAGAAVYIDRDGFAVVTDTLDGTEGAVYEELKDRQQNQVSVRVADRRNIRPSKVVVLITPEVEVRFDYQEPSSSGTRTVPDTDTNALDNVAIMPDPLGLDFTDAAGTQHTIGPGSYVRMDDLFVAYGDGPGYGDGTGRARALSWDILRKHRASAFRYNGAEFSLVNRETGLVDVPWSRRVNQIHQSYRKDFQVREVFMQRLASVRPVRAATVNPVTGTRAASPVYSDYIRRPSIHGLARTVNGALNGYQVQGYAALLANAKAAPATVQILNPGAGVFRVQTNDTGPNGWYEETMLGYSTKGIPGQSLGVAGLNEATQFNAFWDHVELDAQWQMSVVMSCVPGSPNSIGKLLGVEVRPDEVSGLIGRDVGNCWGPVAYVRVFPTLLTARYAWDDSVGQSLVDAVRGVNNTDQNGCGVFPESRLVNRAHVADVAKAAAARVYAGLLDRPFGTLETDMRPDLEPTGAIGEVEHVMQGGATRTLVRFSTPAAPQDIWRFMPASTRRALLRSLQSVADPLTASLGVV